MSFFNKAGKGEHKGGGLQQIFEMAKPALNLSADQEQKITEIFNEFREEKQGLKSGGGDNAKESIRTARQQAKQKIMAVLNDDQKKIFEENISKWKDEVS
jgi:Spy/CpxP family protein refolding chaperone